MCNKARYACIFNIHIVLRLKIRQKCDPSSCKFLLLFFKNVKAIEQHQIANSQLFFNVGNSELK